MAATGAVARISDYFHRIDNNDFRFAHTVGQTRQSDQDYRHKADRQQDNVAQTCIKLRFTDTLTHH